MQILRTTVRAVPGPIARAKSTNLLAACLAHVLHDGYTDGLYAFLPVWQAQFGLSYAALAIVRASTMGLWVPYRYQAIESFGVCPRA